MHKLVTIKLVLAAALVLASCAATPREAQPIGPYDFKAGRADRVLWDWQQRSGIVLRYAESAKLPRLRTLPITGLSDPRDALVGMIDGLPLQIKMDDGAHIELGATPEPIREYQFRPLPAYLAEQDRRLKARNPEAEAAAAAMVGDYRLAMATTIDLALNGTFDFSTDQTTTSQPGLNCRGLDDVALARLVYHQPILFSKDQQAHDRTALNFLARYNRALVAQPGFPDRDLCRPISGTFAPYSGPVRTLPQAVRAHDLDAMHRMLDAEKRPVDELDNFRRTALHWALAMNQEEAARALLAAGAQEVLLPDNAPRPLSVALSHDWDGLIADELARGVDLNQDTHACTRGGILLCTYVTQILQQTDPHRLEQVMSAGLSPTHQIGWDRRNSAFMSAARNHDLSRARQLLGFLDGGGSASTAMDLYETGQISLLTAYVQKTGRDMASSDAEWRVWNAALNHGHADAFEFLAHYGAQLGLLSRERLSDCENLASRGDIHGLLGCAKEAAERRRIMAQAVEAGDEARLAILFDAAADLRQDHQYGLMDLIAEKGSPAMARMLLGRASDLGTTRNESLNAYMGPLAKDAAAWAAASGYDSQATQWRYFIFRPPLEIASDLGRRDMTEALVRAPIPTLAFWVRAWVPDFSDYDHKPPSAFDFESIRMALSALTKADQGDFLTDLAMRVTSHAGDNQGAMLRMVLGYAPRPNA